MKTKTLLIAAAALAAGVMSSQAQGVYSQNIVGYVNVPLAAGYNMIGNQLDLDGTGTNNSIYTTVGTNLPANTTVLVWDSATASFSQSKLTGAGKWTLNNNFVTNAVNPGSGFFINVPAATNVTFVGTVITGTNSYPIVAGYQVVAPSAPVTGGIGTSLGYTPTKGDAALIWNNSTASYTQRKYTGTAWTGGEPTFTVGQAIFLNAASNTNWTQTLNVQ